MGAIGKIIQKNVDELKNPLFYRALISEFVGTYLLIFIGCFSVFPWHQTNSTSQHDPSLVQVALCFGVLIGLLVTALSNVSGCHINPAVTIPMLLTRKITLIRAAFYLIAQMLGSIVAIYILKCLTPKSIYRSDFLMLASVQGVTDSQVLFAEAFITFLLVFTVYACCDSGKPYLKSSGPLSIGLSVTVGAFAAVSLCVLCYPFISMLSFRHCCVFLIAFLLSFECALYCQYWLCNHTNFKVFFFTKY